ncbi:MAG: hypothetical protein IKY81_02830 [Methanocorpusculum sp.]|nr:hypothetical protein [Methanocorpusculum sp.]
MTEEKPIDHPRLILGAVGLALGIAVLVLSLLDAVRPETAVLFLSVSVICFGLSALLPRRE